jgi:hypothetical protein
MVGLPEDTAMTARMVAIWITDLSPMNDPPQDLAIYLCVAPQWNAQVSAPKALPCGFQFSGRWVGGQWRNRICPSAKGS